MALTRELFAALNGNNTPPSTEPTLPTPTAPMPTGGETPAERAARILKEKLALITTKGGNKQATSVSKVSPEEVEKFVNWGGSDPKNWENEMNRLNAGFSPLKFTGTLAGKPSSADNKIRPDFDRDIKDSMLWQKSLSDGVIAEAKQRGLTNGAQVKAMKDELWKAGLKNAQFDNPQDAEIMDNQFNKKDMGRKGTQFWNAHAQLFDNLIKKENDSKATPPTKTDLVKK